MKASFKEIIITIILCEVAALLTELIGAFWQWKA